jgi:hypothetical protein
MKSFSVLLSVVLFFFTNSLIWADELTDKKGSSPQEDLAFILAHNKIIYALCINRDVNQDIISCGIISSEPGGWAAFRFGTRYGSNGACRSAGYDGAYYDHGAGGFYSSEYYSSVEAKKRKVCP